MPTCGVREVIEYAAVTSVPLLPPALRGVINLRGAAVPVLDLGMRLPANPIRGTKASEERPAANGGPSSGAGRLIHPLG